MSIVLAGLAAGLTGAATGSVPWAMAAAVLAACVAAGFRAMGSALLADARGEQAAREKPRT